MPGEDRLAYAFVFAQLLDFARREWLGLGQASFVELAHRTLADDACLIGVLHRLMHRPRNPTSVLLHAHRRPLSMRRSYPCAARQHRGDLLFIPIQHLRRRPGRTFSSSASMLS